MKNLDFRHLKFLFLTRFTLLKSYEHAVTLGMAVRTLNHGGEVGVTWYFPHSEVLILSEMRDGEGKWKNLHWIQSVSNPRP
jgi:hypothetical protein